MNLKKVLAISGLHKPRCRGAEQSGFALLIVLWTMALLGLLGSTITSAGRSEAKIAANLLASANAQAAADGGVAVAAYHLLDKSDQHWEADGIARRVRIGDSEVKLIMRDQRGKIDPNDATSGLLTALLRQLGVEEQTATTVGSAILDWRVANDTGLSKSYAASGRTFGPPHEPFESLEEISLVMGVTPQLMALMAPHLSLYVEQTPAVAQADPIVAAAITDAVKREQLTLNEDQQPGPLIVSVVASARNRGAVFTRTVLLRMNGIANQPYEVLDWRGG
jgi:general secretion pathway protein K